LILPSTGTRRGLAFAQAVLLTATLLAALSGSAQAATAVPPTPANLPAAIEAYQPYVGQAVCDPVAKPGVRAFSNLLLDTYPDSSTLGIVRDCGVGGQSEHKEGRAFDWGVSVTNAKQKAEADGLLAWLLKADSAGNKAANARRFGIMYMIWNKQMWRAYDPDKGWQPYSGTSEHTDHVHFSFGWNGAKQVTSWWTGKVAPVDYGPSGKQPITPERLPANLLVLATYGATVLQQGSADQAATKVVQRALQITADGDFGPTTTAAVKEFQTSQKVTADGVVNSNDWPALFPKPQAPFGALETSTFGIPGTVAVKGWAIDADTPDPIRVHLYVDGALNTALVAGDSRPDVEKVYPGMGPELGYATALTLTDGAHTICAYAINVGAGNGNPSIGCKTVSVRHSPFGHADALRLAPGSLVTSGWVFDPDSAAVVQVTHTVDGVPLATVAASASRPDVGAHYTMYGNNRGYTADLDLSTVAAGSHTLCAVATNVDAGADTPLACTTVTVRHTPFGAFDSLVQTPDGLALGGWAIEPDVAGPATVTGTLDGVAVPDLQAGLDRPDIGRLYPIDGAAHGFSAVLPVPAQEGSHTLCLTVANVGPGPAATARCRTIVVAHRPFGRFDVVSVSKGQVTVKGWTVDPDTRSPVTVHVRIDGALVGKSAASILRADVARAFPQYGGNHGFRYTPSTVLAKGTHNVCVYAINSGAGSGNPLLACHKVTVA
jgi:peptidoglycan hydrolase-like protein with peptidoglycan-binding domain